MRAINGSTVSNGRIVRLRMPRSWLARAQVVEYLRSFLIGRTGWASMGTLLLISGAFGVYRRDVVIEAGGLDPDSIGEDFELCLRVHKMMRDRGRDYRVVFVPEPVCWTEVPSTRAVLRRQRSRWHRGLWETLWAYRGMLFRRRYGRIGWVGLPYYWLFELVAPLIEAGGLVLVPLGMAFGVVNVQYALILLLVSYGYAIFVTLAAMCAEEWAFHRYDRWRDLGIAVAAAVFENLGYRQMTVLVAPRGLVGQPARQEAGVGRDDPDRVRGGGRVSADEDWQARAAVVGHELRAPLTSIEGWVEILLDGALGELTPEQARAVEVIGRNAQRLRSPRRRPRLGRAVAGPVGRPRAGRAGRRRRGRRRAGAPDRPARRRRPRRATRRPARCTCSVTRCASRERSSTWSATP